MNANTIVLFNRRSILSVVLIIGLGFVLTAAAIRLFASGFELDRATADTFVSNFQRVFEDGDSALVDADYAEDFVGHLPQMPFVTRAGWKEYLDILRGGIPTMRVDVHEAIVSGDRLIVRANLSGSHTGELFGVARTDRWLSVPALAIFRFNEDGRVVENWFSIDTLGLLMQMQMNTASNVPVPVPGGDNAGIPLPSNLPSFHQN